MRYGQWLKFEEYTKTIRVTPDNYCVASMATFGEGGSLDAAVDQPEHLFKLMAASPDLYEACKQALEDLSRFAPDHTNATRRQLKQALAKARGE